MGTLSVWRSGGLFGSQPGTVLDGDGNKLRTNFIQMAQSALTGPHGWLRWQLRDQLSDRSYIVRFHLRESLLLNQFYIGPRH